MRFGGRLAAGCFPRRPRGCFAAAPPATGGACKSLTNSMAQTSGAICTKFKADIRKITQDNPHRVSLMGSLLGSGACFGFVIGPPFGVKIRPQPTHLPARRAAAAQISHGRMYEIGQGVAKDAARAVSSFRKGAEQGLADAQYRLAEPVRGVVVCTGETVPSVP